jgi:hypothetical protein
VEREAVVADEERVRRGVQRLTDSISGPFDPLDQLKC